MSAQALNEALQLPANSAVQLRFGTFVASILGAQLAFGGAVGRS